MDMELYNSMSETANNYASAVGFLRGTLIGEMLYNDITPSKFKKFHSTLLESYNLTGGEMSEFDISRIKQRAEEIGVELGVI